MKGVSYCKLLSQLVQTTAFLLATVKIYLFSLPHVALRSDPQRATQFSFKWANPMAIEQCSSHVVEQRKWGKQSTFICAQWEARPAKQACSSVPWLTSSLCDAVLETLTSSGSEGLVSPHSYWFFFITFIGQSFGWASVDTLQMFQMFHSSLNIYWRRIPQILLKMSA